MYRGRLAEFGIAEKVISKLEADAMAIVDQATEEAKASPVPSLDAIETNLWADGGSSWRN
jgi:pyruvate dehydrogenase E1 component alpha subunit